MQSTLVDGLPRLSSPGRPRHARVASRLQATAKKFLIVLQALPEALWMLRRYERLRSKGIAHDAAIRKVLLGGPHD
jgi:hypothetical protein